MRFPLSIPARFRAALHAAPCCAFAFPAALAAVLGSACHGGPPASSSAVTAGPGGGGFGVGGGGGADTGKVGPKGGTLDTLSFAIVGDTRPAHIDDTPGYPFAVVSRIWQDVEAYSPHPAFAITTGDYMFAKSNGAEGHRQLDLYLAARSLFSGTLFPALGNHECTGGTGSNCGAGNADGVTLTYLAFLSKMLGPLGIEKPYYVISVGSKTNAWTAKLVFIAPNAWDDGQAAWLDAELAKPTTYTFIVRHEGVLSVTAPGLVPSQAIVAKHPFTLLISGHTHTYAHSPADRQIIVGNGGAPLTTAVDYGYVVARQRPDGAMVFKEHDYSTNAVNDVFAVNPDGTPAP